ncbi:AI-2E family transporter [Balneatrix alpica]|uniref:AI-2E family transporter n=1 Tax=Balneatrix alpica TaxID=75684 RepID=A0ABV5Z6S3_9GAMM|nr:AI-2E family transporter [Balneatrix alpica]
MLKVLSQWIERHFSNEEALVLFFQLLLAFIVVITMGGMLAPVFASVILAFLLQGAVSRVKRYGVRHWLAVSLVFVLAIGLFFGFVLFFLPIIWTQFNNLLKELPRMLAEGQALLNLLPQKYPTLVSPEQVRLWTEQAAGELGKLGQVVLTFSLSSIANLMTLLVYMVLIPIMMFFFMKDGSQIVHWWAQHFLPKKRKLLHQVWVEMDAQIANYIRGKVIEIIIVGVATYVVFAFLDLRYAALLALFVGLSVLIPYIGAAVVTVPVAMIGYFQWGWSNEFIYLMVGYGIIQALDGNVLVPLLFSEAVNLHPVAIILAVLVFGGLWGFWGVFFSIPLATLCKAVLYAWPRQPELEEQT